MELQKWTKTVLTVDSIRTGSGCAGLGVIVTIMNVVEALIEYNDHAL